MTSPHDPYDPHEQQYRQQRTYPQQPYQQGPPPGYYQPPPPGYQPGPGHGRPPRRRHTGRNVALSLLGVLVLIIAISAAESSGGKAPAASGSAAGSSSPAAVASHPAASAKPRVIARFAGSGQESTGRFVIPAPGNWTLHWSYDCASFGYKGNFAVDEDKGGSDFNGANVNELGMHGHGVTHVYSDSGRHFLEVDSECSWSMRVLS